ncbi:L,D-transpeptidase [Methylocapsa palsarum]|uniref:Lipoprotein-anchoring transpeptidase ErfK/SrfK n=1 Tax=Methylocapsa palsarum TaxID=1612308 RepID=A0A1I3X5N6_9HYPH|nr:L,D-transpeptidase [Methylocapsa palsarum]SFK14176.1 Lipoprotein-anchoring transpeptidase ErfK/SrfK [Methylocapsa palsarum]
MTGCPMTALVRVRWPILAAALVMAALSVSACTFSSVPDPSLSDKDAQLLASAPDFELDADYKRYKVDDPTGEPPGTIVVDTKARHLYFVEPDKKAIRYGVAVGSEAFGWTGTAVIGRMSEWPRWMPPAEMLERWPHLRPTAEAGGLPGGPGNPLGARAMYLYHDNVDTLYRIHGTNEPGKIGTGVSSGCIRMTNIDAIDLYNRVKVGTKVIVK